MTRTNKQNLFLTQFLPKYVGYLEFPTFTTIQMMCGEARAQPSMGTGESLGLSGSKAAAQPHLPFLGFPQCLCRWSLSLCTFIITHS